MFLNKIKLLTNRYRLLILLLIQEEALSITEISSTIKLSYNKCADYITLMEKEGLVSKRRKGKKTKVRSIVKIKVNELIEF
ncbi:MAG: winged helix-turn-helix transcriptional regulator [Nanoarchaeota archaeon]|nr:winged helix-turn-helix transcriptional regulator [Nanoarchaeota archaeon]MCK5630552.1 winged helix-turn-helix transcriptional regulator [Nanoarchaeota archaeon]